MRQSVEEMKDNYTFEMKYYAEGFQYIAGTDEVGRGPLAGPVVASAVIMPRGCYIEGVTDSKKLSGKKRKALRAEIEKKALSIVSQPTGHATGDKRFIPSTRFNLVRCDASTSRNREYPYYQGG